MIVQIIDDLSTLRLVDMTTQGLINISVEKSAGIILEVRGDVLRFTYPMSDAAGHTKTIEILFQFVTNPASISAEDLRTQIEAMLDKIPTGFLTAANFTDLNNTFPPASHSGELAHVANSQGTPWLPGSMLGTFYSKGWYLSDGVAWVDDSDEIANALQGLIDDKLATVSTDATITGDGTIGAPLSVVENLPDFFSISDNSEVITFSETGVVYITLNASGLTVGDQYELEGFYIWAHDSTGSDFFMEVRNNATLIFPDRHQQEPKDSAGAGGGGTDQRHYNSISTDLTVDVSGAFSIDMNFGTTNAVSESTLFFGYLSLTRKN